MKISQKQRKKNREKIIASAVDIMIENGFKSATMRAIAKSSGLGDATIYNYFPTKESILFAYYEEKLKECIEKLKNIEDFNQFTLHEQLQTFFETQLQLFLPDREFVALSFKRIFFSLNQNYKQIKPIRELYGKIIVDIFNAAAEVNEIPEQIFQDLIDNLLWDYYVGTIIFWLNDESEQFSDTSVLVDKTLDLMCAVLKSGVMNKVFDITSYLFKSHILNRFDGFRRRVDTIKLLKREFMGTADAKRDT
ncbi:MAG: TetR/AcrR family transcriptional regulator [Proteobacteria bacterium]|nr:TetR/AcrR family transcriptional regulator [Pseudomonadota bacterium]